MIIRIRRALAACLIALGLGAGSAWADQDAVWLGVFQEGAPRDAALYRDLSEGVGVPFAVQMWFKDFSEPFPRVEADAAVKAGTLPNITWEPWLWADQGRITLADINAGKWDAYITDWGKGAAAFGKPVMVRWGHEFNGNWYPWSVAKNGENPKTYQKAYRRVHNLVQDAGAKNVIWVWCPNNGSVPAAAWNAPSLAYPGDQYVDWVALDGYDFDQNAGFSDLFARVYNEVLSVSEKPIYIGEFATSRTGQAKADWIAAMDQDLRTKFPAIKGLVWFSTNKEKDWRLDDSVQSLEGAGKVFSGPRYLHRAEDVAALAAGYGTDLAADRLGSKDLLKVAHRQVAVPRAQLTGTGAPDWTAAAVLPVKTSAGGTGRLLLAWTDEALWLRLEAQFGRPLKSNKSNDLLWNADGIEFTVSTNPAADADRGVFTPTDWQLGFSPGDGAALAPRSWEWTKLKAQVPGAAVTAVPSASGGSLEVKVPWASLGGFKPSAGQVLGFDAAVDQAGPDGNRAAQWVWNGNAEFYNNPVQWGALKLQD